MGMKITSMPIILSGGMNMKAWQTNRSWSGDGAFKVRSDLLSQKIGKTDDWLAALNLCTTIPKQINPLSVLPVKIP